MSDGAGPLIEAMAYRVAKIVRRSRSRAERYIARKRWEWDSQTDLDLASWEWPRWKL